MKRIVTSKIDDLLTKEEYQEKRKEYIEKLSSNKEANSIDYEEFLKLVNEYTELIAGEYGSVDDLRSDIVWEILGPEFRLAKDSLSCKKSIYSSVTDDTVVKAMTQSPIEGLLGGSKWLLKYDYSESDIKLGCLVHEGRSASQIIDLDYLMYLLACYGISSYIDNESQEFHVNVDKPTEDKKYLSYQI